jgi:acetylornithine/succinyldiaminopimelate/putrescine aminotransferase
MSPDGPVPAWQHGSTFGGNPLAAAVSRAALSALVEENLIENSRNRANTFMEQLAEIPSPYVKEVRGKGLLIGVELHPSKPAARAASVRPSCTKGSCAKKPTITSSALPRR